MNIAGRRPGQAVGADMRRFIAPVVAAAMAAGIVATPVVAQGDTKTVLVEKDGTQVDTMLLRYPFDATWVIDDTHILMRDTYRDHYLITLKAPCQKLEMQRGIQFVPALTGRIKAAITYEARDKVGQPCDLTRVEQIESAKAAELRATINDKG
jgi:hypothetical protein